MIVCIVLVDNSVEEMKLLCKVLIGSSHQKNGTESRMNDFDTKTQFSV
jgi:hypothetical protein